jgi:hypothetical protein
MIYNNQEMGWNFSQWQDPYSYVEIHFFILILKFIYYRTHNMFKKLRNE